MRFIAAILFLFLASPLVATVSQTEIVAATLILEAGGEYATGSMEAVKEVLQTRADRRSTTLAHEALRKKQFSCWNEIAPEKGVAIAKKHPRWGKAYLIAVSKNPTDYAQGADHYHAKRVNPYWAKSMVKTATIGNHIFYRSR